MEAGEVGEVADYADVGVLLGGGSSHGVRLASRKGVGAAGRCRVDRIQEGRRKVWKWEHGRK